MDLYERCAFNRWAYYIQGLGYAVIGYQIEPFIIMVPEPIEDEENDE